MNKLIYSIVGSFVMLSIFQVAQSMENQFIEEQRPGIDLGVERNKDIFNLVIYELPSHVESFNQEKRENKKIFDDIVAGLNFYMQRYDVQKFFQQGIHDVEAKREEIAQALILNIQKECQYIKGERKDNKYVFNAVLSGLDDEVKERKVLRKAIQKNKDIFAVVLQEIKKEEVQGCELPQSLVEFFYQEELIKQEEQDIALLTQSLVGAESILQPEKAIEPVTVGLKTRIYDWWYGPSNLESEMIDNKISLDSLKKSPELQGRINNIIQKCSPINKNIDTLPSLKNIYSALKNMKFMAVNSDINTNIYNAAKEWRLEQEKAYMINRKARVLAIAQYLVKEMQQLDKEEEPRLNTMEMLEEIENLTQHTGMIEQVQEEVIEVQDKQPDMYDGTLKVLKIISLLRELCEELKK